MGLQIVSPSELIRSVSFAHSADTESKVPLLINSRLLIPISDAPANSRNTFVYAAEVTGGAASTLGLAETLF